MKRLIIAVMVCLVPMLASARQRTYTSCEQGNYVVNVLGSTSTLAVGGAANGVGIVQASFPSCTVTVYLTGTQTLATIYSDSGGTPKSNPYTATSDGSGFFYADNGRYDVQISGANLPSPVTKGDILTQDLSTGTSLLATTVTYSATPTFAAGSFTLFMMTLTGNVTSSTITGSTTGEVVEFQLCQDGTGGRTFAWPGLFLRPPTIVSSANACTDASFYYDGTNWRQLALPGDSVGATSFANLMTFNGGIFSTSYNNVVEADTHSGATDTLKLQGCLADAITNKTACDARNFTNRTFSSEIDVGDASFDPVTLLLPSSGLWHFTMTDGTSYGVKQFNKTAVIGQGTGEGNAFKLSADSGSNLAVVYGTDPSPSGGGSYIAASGFGVQADASSTIATAVCDVQKLFDGSQVTGLVCLNSAAATSVPVDLLIQNVCCASVAMAVTADAQGNATSGTIPCKVGASVVGVNLTLSCDHPSPAKNNILVDDGLTGTTGPINFVGGYAEGILSGDTTTPLVDIKNERGGVNFFGFYCSPHAVGSTAYCWQIENVANMPVTISHGSRAAGASDFNAINDLFASKTVLSNSAGAAGFVPDYVEDGVASGGVPNYYHNGITSAGAGNFGSIPSPGAIGGSTPAPGTFTTLTANTSLVINGSPALASVSGNSTKLASASGSYPFGNTVKADASGNLVDAGSPPIGFTSVNVTPVTANANTAADQNLQAITITAGVLNSISKTLLLQTAGVYSTPAGSTSIVTLKAKLCTVSGCGSGTVVTLATIASAALGAIQATNDPFNLTLNTSTQTAGASAAFEAHGNLTIDIAALATAAEAVYADGNTTTVGTIDSTAPLFLQITGSFSNASGSNTMTERQLIADVVD